VASRERLAGTPFAFAWALGTLEEKARTSLRLGLTRDANDAEILAAACAADGPSALRDVYGDFALVLVTRTGEVIAATTPGGRSKLYVTADRGVFAWATHPCLLLGDGATCDSEFFLRFFGSLYTGERTPYRGVLRVYGGAAIHVDRDVPRARVERWWKPEVGTLSLPSARDYEHVLRRTLMDSVRRAARGHEKVAIALSAGVDSASLAACAIELSRAGEIGEVVAVSLAMPDDPEGDEAGLAAEMARALGIRHEITTSRFEPTFDETCRIAARIGFPRLHVLLGAWLGAVAHRASELGATVIFDGNGGEALVSDACHAWSPSLPRATALAQTLALARRLGPKQLAKNALQSMRMRTYSLDAASILARRPWLRRLSREGAAPFLPPSYRDAYGNLVLDLEPGETTDRVYFAPSGVESASPYRDRRVIELGFALPLWTRVCRSNDMMVKSLARDAFPEVPRALSSAAARGTVNYAVSRVWTRMSDQAGLLALATRLPESLGDVVDPSRIPAAVTQMFEMEGVSAATDLFAAGLWAEGMRRVGFALA
jgi:asparagine synthetase B (glutamine-hydrolysing)